MKVEFVASVAVITPAPEASRKLYVEALGLPLHSEAGGSYLHSEAIAGTKHFGVWPLEQAAQVCFGAPVWPAARPCHRRPWSSRSLVRERLRLQRRNSRAVAMCSCMKRAPSLGGKPSRVFCLQRALLLACPSRRLSTAHLSGSPRSQR